VAVVSPDLRGLDRDAVRHLAGHGVRVAGLVRVGDDEGERRLRQLGVIDVQPGGAPIAAVAAAVHDAVARRAEAAPPPGFAHAVAPAPPVEPDDPVPAPGGTGRVVAVWGPTGAPGRTTVALGLSHELALRGWPTLLVDADVYGGSVAVALGLPDEAPGLAAACRQANVGALDVPALQALADRLSPTLSVLTGISRAERWPEVRPAGVEVVLSLARRCAAVTVVDCGFALEQDEEITYDTLAPRRNGATLAVLEQADLVVVVGAADPVGAHRLVHGIAELREVVPDARTAVVVNRVRGTAIPAELAGALQREAGVGPVATVPLDDAAFVTAVGRGRPVAAGTPAAQAFQRLVGSLVGSR
jgi:Mrp family chromosome partitioning ATPase